MKIRSILTGATLVVATAVITTQVVSQEAKPGAQPPAMPPEMVEMMEKMTAAGTPGDNHKLLVKKAGNWNCKVKMWWTPDVPDAEESPCTVNSELILGGRWLLETVEGNFNGETFTGHGVSGYDNVTKKFTSVWIDSMSTSAMISEGTYDAAKKTFTYAGENTCPLAGKRVTGRTVERWTDDNNYVVEMYGPYYKTGKEYKSMEITYTRAK